MPAQYDPAKPACLLVKLDGLGAFEGTVLDNLIAKKDVPVMIGVGIVPGTIWRDPPDMPNRRALRFNRSYEFDSMNDHFPNFVLNEVLPAVQKLKTLDGRPIRLSSNANDRAATGASTGGIGSFTLAWLRPDQFGRVYSVIGTFVAMRGGNEYPALIRKTEPKPIRVFLEDGSADAWNPLFGSWFDANLNMESALSFAGYDVAHAWSTHGHDGKPGQVIFPDVLRWLWRDYPAAVPAGVSHNSTLQEVLQPNENWREFPARFQRATSLAADSHGDVYVSDAGALTIQRLSGNGDTSLFARESAVVESLAFSPDGTLYGLVPAQRKVIGISGQGTIRTVAEGIAGHGIVVTHGGDIYVSDEAGQVWQVRSGRKKVMDQGTVRASGMAFSPDGGLFFAAERASRWIDSYVVQPDGALSDKQQFDWLHTADVSSDSGTEDLAMDTHGNLYAATRLGIQVCDQNGRVRAILPMPTPGGAARGLCFGGEHFDVLYVTDGMRVFARKMKVKGFAQWDVPVAVTSQVAG